MPWWSWGKLQSMCSIMHTAHMACGPWHGDMVLSAGAWAVIDVLSAGDHRTEKKLLKACHLFGGDRRQGGTTIITNLQVLAHRVPLLAYPRNSRVELLEVMHIITSFSDSSTF